MSPISSLALHFSRTILRKRRVRIKAEPTPPARRSDRQRLEDLPGEVYLEIIEYLLPHPSESDRTNRKRIRDLLSLSLVCRYFNALALPLTYYWIVFPLDGSVQTKNYRSYAPFRRLLNPEEANASQFATYVRHCFFEELFMGRIISNTPTAWTVPDALSKMSNITSTTFAHTCLFPEFLESLGQLPNLDYLAIDSCNFYGLVVEDIQRLAFRLSLRTFRLLLGSGGWLAPIPEFSLIEAFVPLTANLKELHTDSWDLIHSMISASPIPPMSLRVLRVRCIREQSVFYEWIYQSPTLASLTIDYPYPLRSDILRLSQLPALRSLTCSPNFAQLLADSHLHNLTHLSFVISPPRMTVYLTGMMFYSSDWCKLDRYRSVSELTLPYSIAINVRPHSPPVVTRLVKFTITWDGILPLFVHSSDYDEAIITDLFSDIWCTPSLKELVFDGIIFNGFRGLSKREAKNIQLREKNKDVIFTRKLIRLLTQETCCPGLIELSFCNITEDGGEWSWKKTRSESNSGHEWALVEYWVRRASRLERLISTRI